MRLLNAKFNQIQMSAEEFMSTTDLAYDQLYHYHNKV